MNKELFDIDDNEIRVIGSSKHEPEEPNSKRHLVAVGTTGYSADGGSIFILGNESSCLFSSCVF